MATNPALVVKNKAQVDAAAKAIEEHKTRFDGIADIAERRQAILTALEAAPAIENNPERTLIREYLVKTRDSINASIEAAQDRFDAQNFDFVVNMRARKDAIVAAITDTDSIIEITNPVERAHYMQLLDAKRLETTQMLARMRFDDCNFSGFDDLQLRLSAILTTENVLLENADPDERAYFQNLLSQARVITSLAIQEAQCAYALNSFDAIGDLVARHCAMVAELDELAHAPAPSAVHVDARSYYLMLVTAARDVTAVAIQEAKEAELKQRFDFIDSKLGGIAALGLRLDDLRRENEQADEQPAPLHFMARGTAGSQSKVLKPASTDTSKKQAPQ